VKHVQSNSANSKVQVFYIAVGVLLQSGNIVGQRWHDFCLSLTEVFHLPCG